MKMPWQQGMLRGKGTGEGVKHVLFVISYSVFLLLEYEDGMNNVTPRIWNAIDVTMKINNLQSRDAH